MRQRDEKYHIQVKPELLFDSNNKFKSFYSPWIFIYLKLDFNNFIHNAPNSFYKIDVTNICTFFNVDRSTVSRVLNQLIQIGLIEKRGSKYKILNDFNNLSFDKNELFPEFIQIHNNFFIDFVELLKREFDGLRKQPRSLIKVVQVFYYLITKNHHVMVELDRLESKETVKSINKALRHDERYIKEYLKILEIIGYIEYDESGNIYTIYRYGTSKPIEQKNTNQKNKIVKKTTYCFEETVPEEVGTESEYSLEELEQVKEETEPANNFTNPEQEETETESACNEVKLQKNKINIQEKQKSEPITDEEKIKYIELMSGDDMEKRKRLVEQFKIPMESIRKYIEKYESGK